MKQLDKKFIKDRYMFCICQNMPDGVNYYAGVSKIKLGEEMAVGIEWSLDSDDATRYVSKETANVDLKNIVLPDNPFARIEPIEQKDYIFKP